MVQITFISLLLILFRFLQIKKSKRLSSYLNQGPWGDAITYLFLIQFFRNRSCGVPDERCLIGNDNVLVPSLYMKIVSKLFNDTTLIKYPWLPNFLIFIISIPIAVTLCKDLLIVLLPDLNASYIALMIISSVLLFIFQIDNWDVGHLRLHWWTLQPRFLVLVTNSIFWLIVVSSDDFKTTLISCSILCFISLNTSIFARQCTFFSIILYTFFSSDYLPVISLILSFILSCIIFPKEFWPSLKPQFLYAKMYFKNFYKPDRNCNYFIYTIKIIFAHSVTQLIKYPAFYICFFFYLYIYSYDSSYFADTNKQVNYKIFCFLISILLISFTTSLRKFASLGESWRYISCSCYYIPSIVLPIHLISYFNDISIFIIVLITILIYQLIISENGSKEEINGSKNLLQVLNDIGKTKLRDAVWHSTPYRHGTFAIAYGFGKRTFEFQYGNHSEDLYKNYFLSFSSFLKNDSDFLLDNKVTHIIIDNSFEFDDFGVSRIPDISCNLLSQNSHFKIYQVDQHLND